MNLLFAINKKFVNLFLTCMKSILHNGGNHNYTAYILHSDIDQSQIDVITHAVGERVKCQFISIASDLFEGFPETKRYPKQIYYRIAAPYLLPDTLDRILYLDVDTVIINPLDELYKMEFDGAYYIACTHTKEFLTKLNQMRLDTGKEVPYINTGVMVFNLPALRKNLSMEEIRSYANEKKHSLILPDQDILTALYGENIKLADTMRYNLSDRILTMYNLSPQNHKIDLEWVRENSVIIHYCGKNKPWKERYVGILDVFYRDIVQQN